MNRKYLTTKQAITQREINHDCKLRKIAAESIVLLKNDGTLPLKCGGNVALFGNGARNTVKGGVGSGDVNARHSVSVLEGLQYAGFSIPTVSWLDLYDENLALAKKQFTKHMLEKAKSIKLPPIMLLLSEVFAEPEHNITSTINLAALNTDTAIYVLARNSGEGKDRILQGDFCLKQTEERDITYLAEYFKKFILVLNVGGVIDIAALKADNNINSIVLMSQLGSIGGNALCDILIGKDTPSGKLTTTWANNYFDYPNAAKFSHLGGNLNDSFYDEGIYVGYRHFDTYNILPCYEFGYGLSYTQFDISSATVTVSNDKVNITATVTNVGNFVGKEVLQAYCSAPSGTLDKPYQQLCTFIKTKLLKPQEKQVLTLSFSILDMASFCEIRTSYILERGVYNLRLGNSSKNTKIIAQLNFDEKILNTVAKTNCTRQQYKSDCVEKITFPMVSSGKYTLKQLVAQLTPLELATICCGAFKGDAGMQIIGNGAVSVQGAAGETTSALSATREIPALIMADGPAGLRLLHDYFVDKDGNFLYSDFSSIAGLAEFMGTELPSKPNLCNAEKRYQYASAIPIATALAQSWNADYLYETGKLIADEMIGFGIHLWLAPGMNIQKNPLCGRNFEYFSEDPLLSGKCAVFMTKGVQSKKGVGVTIKHFACNNQEANRNHNNSTVSQRALREIYLKGFEIAVKEANPIAIMTSYNLLNGEHTANSYNLLQCILRDEWKFDGLVMSDWGTTGNGGFSDARAIYPTSDPAGCIKAGNDIIMPGSNADIQAILDSINNTNAKYPITLADLHFCACNVLGVCLKLG